MFDGKGPISDGTIGWTIQKVKNLMTKHPQAHLFQCDFQVKWLPKVIMWIVIGHNLPYAIKKLMLQLKVIMVT